MSIWLLNLIVAMLDLAATFTIVCLMLETTKRASVAGFLRGDSQSIWAMVRRAIYTVVAITLFAKTVFTLDGKIVMLPLDSVIWIIVVSSMIFFPALRALGIIDQDHWVGWRRDR